jgi:hypothetical protein
MLTEDYLMRMINIAVAALLRAIGLRKEGQYSLAHQTIDQALENLTGIRANLLSQIDDRSIIRMLMIGNNLDIERALLVADLYAEQGEIYQLQNQSEPACFCQLRALNLYSEAVLDPSIENNPAQQEKIERLVSAARNCEMPFETRYSLFSYYESIGNYAKADQTMRQMLETGLFHQELKLEYKDFCLRLLDHHTGSLENGGLTREKVEQNLRQIG